MAKKTRRTKQKKIIAEELRKFSTFFTADELFNRARKKDERLGKATVYRYLKEMGCNEELHCYNCDRRKVYSLEKNSHCHFICSKCGKTSHFNIDNIDGIKRNINGKICHFQIDVYGICGDCLK